MRLLSTLLLIVATLFLVAGLALHGGHYLLNQKDADKRINAMIKQYASGVEIGYDKADFELSLRGIRVRLANFHASIGEGQEIKTASADVWLTQGGVYIQLESPDILLVNLADIGTAAPTTVQQTVVIYANDARFRLGEHVVENADVNILRSDEGWNVNFSETSSNRRLRLRANLNHQGRGNIYAEFSGKPPPEVAPLAGRDMRATVWADSGEDGVTYVVAGDVEAVTLPSLQATRATWRAGGIWQSNHTPAFPSVAFSIWAQSVAVQPAVLPAPADIAVAGVWRKHEQGDWSLNLGDLTLSDHAVTVIADARVDNKGDDTIIQAHGRLIDMPLTLAQHYVPPGEVRDWLASSLLDGYSRNAMFAVRTNARFEPESLSVHFTTDFVRGVIDISDNWPRANALNGVFVVNDNDIQIIGQGRFAELYATDIYASIPRVDAERTTLYLDIAAAPNSMAAHFRSALRVPPIAAEVRQAQNSYHIEEELAVLSLSLAVPLATPEDTRIRAKLSLHDAAIHNGDWAHLIGVNGAADMDNNGVRGRLIGKLRDAADFSRLTLDFTDTALTVNGIADASYLLNLGGISAVAVTGGVNFQYAQSPQMTTFTAPLTGIDLALPPPFATSLASVSVHFAAADVRRAMYRNNAITLHIVSDKGGLDVAINTLPLTPPNSGINVHGGGDDIDLDLWRQYLAAGAADGALSGLLLTLRRPTLLGVRHDLLRVQLLPQGGYAANLESPYMRGDLTLNNDFLAGHFSHVSLPEYSTADDALEQEKESWNSAPLTLSLSVDLLQYGAITLGVAQLYGILDDEHWDISRLAVSNGQTTLSLSGVYEEKNTYLTVRLDAPDVPELLSVFNVNEGLAKGELSLFGQIGWRGDPLQFDISKMKGGVRFQGADVRFSNIKTSTRVINFLSLFSPQSLFSLGFTELAEPAGIEFSSVLGVISMRDGEATTDSIQLSGDDIQMNIYGKTNYIRREHELRGRVRPGEKLLGAGSAIGLGLTAVNPLSLVASALFGKLFERPISEIGAYEYKITGSWDAPKYEELGTTTINGNQRHQDN